MHVNKAPGLVREFDGFDGADLGLQKQNKRRKCYCTYRVAIEESAVERARLAGRWRDEIGFCRWRRQMINVT